MLQYQFKFYFLSEIYCWLVRVSLLIISGGAHSFLGTGEGEPLAVL